MTTYSEAMNAFDDLSMKDQMDMIDEVLASMSDEGIIMLGHFLGDEAKANLSRAENFYLHGKTAHDYISARKITRGAA